MDSSCKSPHLMNENESKYLTIYFSLSCPTKVDRGLPIDLGERDNCLIVDVSVIEYSPHPNSLIYKEGVMSVKGVATRVSGITNDSISAVGGAA